MLHSTKFSTLYKDLFCFVFLLGLLLPLQLHAKWSTTKFTIVRYDAAEVDFKFFNEMIDKVTPDKDDELKLETIFTKIAKRYEDMGFREPTLERHHDGSYKVYMYDVDPRQKKVGGFFYDICAKESRLVINTHKLHKKNGQIILTNELYTTLSHELFHAIQKSYPLFTSHCKNERLGDWITEGTATAIGQDMIRLFSNTDPKPYKIEDAYWGFRRYSIPLHIPYLLQNQNYKNYPHQAGHFTAGLWRYIGEYISNTMKPDSKEKKLADYRYLHHFFEQNFKGNGEKAEIKWLDKALREYKFTKMPLAKMYANFITTFAYYSPDRTMRKDNEKWRKCLFGSHDCISSSKRIFSVKDPCRLYRLNAGQETTVILKIKKMSAGCFILDNKSMRNVMPGQQPFTEIGIDLDLRVHPEQVNMLSIGTKIKKNNSQYFSVQRGDTPQYKSSYDTNTSRIQSTYELHTTSWHFEMTSNPQLFIVSNFAEESETTKDDTFTLYVNIPMATIDSK